MGLRWVPLLVVGMGSQALFGPASTPWIFLVASMALIAGFLFINRTRPGFRFTLLGVALNAIVIGLNGAMPVSQHAMRSVGLSGVPAGDLRHAAAEPGTHLSFLGDVIPLGERVVSIGDVLMLAGLAWFLVSTTLSLLWRPSLTDAWP